MSAAEELAVTGALAGYIWDGASKVRRLAIAALAGLSADANGKEWRDLDYKTQHALAREMREQIEQRRRDALAAEVTREAS